jgi:nucleotide-binding universal stress UspA family protein
MTGRLVALTGRAGRQGITGALADGRTMYPPEIGLRAEDSILVQLASQARETLAQLKTDGVVGDDVVLQVATGNGWDEALETAEWKDGDLLALGTTSRRS